MHTSNYLHFNSQSLLVGSRYKSQARHLAYHKLTLDQYNICIKPFRNWLAFFLADLSKQRSHLTPWTCDWTVCWPAGSLKRDQGLEQKFLAAGVWPLQTPLEDNRERDRGRKKSMREESRRGARDNKITPIDHLIKTQNTSSKRIYIK